MILAFSSVSGSAVGACILTLCVKLMVDWKPSVSVDEPMLARDVEVRSVARDLDCRIVVCDGCWWVWVRESGVCDVAVDSMERL